MYEKIKTLLQGRPFDHIFPFFWLHGEDEGTLRRYVQVIADAGLNAFCLESRPHPDFAGDGWWHDLDIILEEASSRGMKVWILDDSHFPSGYANGALREASPELCRQSLVREVVSCEGGKIELSVPIQAPAWKPNLFEQFSLPKEHLREFGDDRILRIAAIPEEKAEKSVDLTQAWDDGILRTELPEGKWQVCVLRLTRNRGPHRDYVNMMNAASCQKMLEAVYEPHYAHYARYFGNTIAGFFSDEPELGNGHLYEYGKSLQEMDDLAWSDEIETALQQKWGTHFGTYLALLWEEGAAAAKARCDYMEAVTRAVQYDFSEQIGSWCRAHGVEYIGHVIEDNNQHTRTGSGLGHFFRAMAGQDMAGIDDIGGQVLPQGEAASKTLTGEVRNGPFYHYVLGALGASLGAIDPKKQGRTMCEVFGNYGWEEGVRLEKYLLDHFLVRGVNRFVPHAFSPKAFPDPDCPPHFYAQGNHPQYRHFGALMRYGNRVCELFSGGRHESPVAILYHAECEWMGNFTPPEEVAAPLAEAQINYDFIPADVFAEPQKYQTKVGEKLSVHTQTYRCFLIPAAQYVPASVVYAAIEMQAKGGVAVFLDHLPEGMYDGERILPLPAHVYYVCKKEELVAYLEKKGVPEVRLQPPAKRMRVLHYQNRHSVWMFVNEGTQAYEGVVSLPDRGSCYEYDAWENAVFQADRREENDKTVLNLCVEPLKSVIIVFDEADAPVREQTKQGMPWNDGWTRSICRSIDYPHFGKEKEVTLPDHAEQEYPDFSGFLRYEKILHCERVPKRAVLSVSDAYEGVEVFVNGTSAGIQIAPPFRYDMTSLLQAGENTVRIEVATTLERELAHLPDPTRQYLGLGPKVPTVPSGINGEVYLDLEENK